MASESTASVLCSIFRRLSSLRTNTTGVVDVSLCSGSLSILLGSLSTWYLQHGSGCQETIYTPAHIKLVQPSGSTIESLFGFHDAITVLSPHNTAALCRKLPTDIHRAVSNPNCTGSMIIVSVSTSKAWSSSASNSSSPAWSYTSRMMRYSGLQIGHVTIKPDWDKLMRMIFEQCPIIFVLPSRTFRNNELEMVIASSFRGRES